MCVKAPFPSKIVSSFAEYDSSFKALSPFAYYSFMCASLPFYFDEQRPKLHHRQKEMYRFRASVTNFSLELNQGFTSMTYYLGLKQPLRTSAFLEAPEASSFVSLASSWEYGYLLRRQSSLGLLAQAPLVSDYFYGKRLWPQLSIFLLISLFERYQRRWCRPHYHTADRPHLQMEPFFLMSALHFAGSLQAMPLLSNHFSFLTNSWDRRSSILALERFFDYKARILLSHKLYHFSLSNGFFKPSLLPLPVLLPVFLFYAIGKLQEKLMLSLRFTFLLWARFPASNGGSLVHLKKCTRPEALGLTSALSFYRRGLYYKMPKALLFALRPNFYVKQHLFLGFRANVLSSFRFSSLPFIPRKVKGKTLRRTDSSLFKAVHRALAAKPKVRRQRRWAKSLSEQRTKATPSRVLLQATKALKRQWRHLLRQRFFLKFSRLLGTKFPFESERSELWFQRKLLFAWKRFQKTARYFASRRLWLRKAKRRFAFQSRVPKIYRRYKAVLRNELKQPKSSFLLDVKFLILKLLPMFLLLQKAKLFPSSTMLEQHSSSQFVVSVSLFMYHYFLLYNQAALVKATPLSVWRKLSLLERYRVVKLHRWLQLWDANYGSLKRLYRSLVSPSLSPLERAKLRQSVAVYSKRLLKLRRLLWSHCIRIALSAHRLRTRKQSFAVPWWKRKTLPLKVLSQGTEFPSVFYPRALLSRKRKSYFAKKPRKRARLGR